MGAADGEDINIAEQRGERAPEERALSSAVPWQLAALEWVYNRRARRR